MDQSNLLENMVELHNKTKPKKMKIRKKKRNNFDSINALCDHWELTLNAFRRLPIALAQLKAGNTSENLLN